MPVQNIGIISGIMKAHKMDLCYGKEMVLTDAINGARMKVFNPKICSQFCNKCKETLDTDKMVSLIEQEFSVFA